MACYVMVVLSKEPPRPHAARPGGVDDTDRSAAMDERRDPQPGRGSGPTPPRIPGQLSPLQQAWGRYVGHTLDCDHCRDVDRGPCEHAEQLWKTWQAVQEYAFKQLADCVNDSTDSRRPIEEGR